MARGFKSGGRRKGTKNKKTLLREQALAATSITPMEFMLGVMRSDLVEPKLRLEAARSAAAYLYPRPKDGAPTETAKLVEGTTTTGPPAGRLTTWTDADEQRMKYLGKRSYVPGLSAAEGAELDALHLQRLHSTPLGVPWTLEDSARIGWLQTGRQHGRVSPGSSLEEELKLLEQRSAAEEKHKELGL